MKTIKDFEQDIRDAKFALRGAKDAARRDKLQHRITYAQRRIRELQGNETHPLTDEERESLTPDEYFRLFPFALIKLAHEDGLTPPACREAVAKELAEQRRQRLLNHPGVVIATTNDPELRAAWEAEAAEARRVQAEERERLARNAGSK